MSVLARDEKKTRDPLTWLYYVLLLTMPVGLSGIGLTAASTTSGNISISDFVLVPVLFFLLLRMICGYRTNGNQSRLGSKYILFCIAFLTLPMLSMWNVLRFTISLRLPLFAIIKLVVCLLYGLVFLLYLARCTQTEWRRFIIAASIAGLVFSLSCILGVSLHFAGIQNTFAESYATSFRATGFQEDPNLAAIYQVMSISYALMWLRFTKKKPLVISVLCVMLVGAVLTTSKAIILTMAIVLLVLAFLMIIARMGKSFVRVVGIVVAVYIVGVILYNTTSVLDSIVMRMNELFSGDATTALTGRDVLWEAAFKLLENPLTALGGVGIGFFPVVSTTTGISSSMGGYVVHSTFISFLVECGVFQFLLLVALMVGFLYVLVVRVIKHKDEFSLYALWGVISIIIFMNSVNFQNNRMSYVFLTFLFVSLSRMSRGELSLDPMRGELTLEGLPAETEGAQSGTRQGGRTCRE